MTTTPTKNESLPELPVRWVAEKNPDAGWIITDGNGNNFTGSSGITLAFLSADRAEGFAAGLNEYRAQCEAALTREAPTDGVNVEAMLVACVPGGSSVDPQTVADNIREWFATPPATQRLAQDEPLCSDCPPHEESDDMRCLSCPRREVEPPTQPPHHDRGEVEAAAVFAAMLKAPYGDTTIGDIVCAETTRGRLESAWLPILAAALTEAKQQGPGEADDALIGRAFRTVLSDPAASRWFGTSVCDFIERVVSTAAEQNPTHKFTPPQVEAKRQTGASPALMAAGWMLSNCAYNLAQCDRLTDAERRSLDESRKAWDAAAAKPSGEGN